MDKTSTLPQKTRISAVPLLRERSEWAWVAASVVLLLVLTSVPYLYAYATTPADQAFMGIMLDVPDHAQYFSWMRELTTANLAANKMTPEANQPIFFNLLWWGLGRLGRLLGLGYAGTFQMLRVVAVALFLPLVYLICTWFFEDRLKRRTAFAITVLTSGFGWALVALKYLTGSELLSPMDVFIAEGNTFLGVLGYPHFIAAVLYVVVFYLILRGQAVGRLRYAVWAGMIALFLGWQHTYDLVSVYGVLLAYAVLLWLRDRRPPAYLIRSGIIVGLLSCSPAIYSVWLTRADPVWKQVLAQFANAGVFTPAPWHLPILLGGAFLLAIYAVARQNPLRLKDKDDRQVFLLGWFLVTFALVYLPVDFQIHLINGWQIPIALLATQGLFDYGVPFVRERILPRMGRLGRHLLAPAALERALAVLFLLAILPTNVYLWAWRFVDLGRHTYPYYLYQDDLAAMRWIEAHARPDDVVLSSLTIGQYIPALTGTHAYLAHWAETLDFYTKQADVAAFYSAASDDATRRAILAQGRVRYVYAGPAERAAGGAALEGLPYLEQAFTSPRVTVYAVRPGGVGP